MGQSRLALPESDVISKSEIFERVRNQSCRASRPIILGPKGSFVEAINRKQPHPVSNEMKESNSPRKGPVKKPVPPDQTNAENFYYLKQMQAKTPMVFVLRDGETLYGVIEWYDKSCLKINRDGAPNLLLFKPNIKYMYKDERAG